MIVTVLCPVSGSSMTSNLQSFSFLLRSIIKTTIIMDINVIHESKEKNKFKEKNFQDVILVKYAKE